MIARICELLKPFSKTKIGKLGRYIEYRSNAPDLQILFTYFKDEHPNYKPDKATKENVANKLFGDREKSIRTLENVVGKLLTCILDFIVAEQVESNLTKSHATQSHSKEYCFILLDEYQKKGLDDDFFRLVRKLEKDWDLNKTNHVGVKHIQDFYRLWTLKFIHSAFPNKVEMINEAYKNIFISLDKYYFASKLYWTLAKENSKKVFTEAIFNGYQTFPTDRIIEYLTINSADFGPQNYLLAKISGVHYKNDFNLFLEIKKDFLDKSYHFNDSERIDLVQFLTDICMDSYKAGVFEAMDVLFELKKYAVENQILIENGHISNDVFISIVHIACLTNRVKWATEFVKDYSGKITKRVRQDTIHLANATIRFTECNYDKVLYELSEIKSKEFVYNIRARILSLITFFKLEVEVTFTAGVNAFKAYINNHKNEIGVPMYDSIWIFISFLEKIHKYKNRPETNKSDFEEIKGKIEKCNKVGCKIWLLVIINDLIDKT